jgi:glycosyltransferase involved in cell wall biosynthesis
MPSTSILVPAFNEAGAIGDVLAAIQAVRTRLDGPSELIVIDDGSADDTAQIAARAGARVIARPYNRGKGAALKTGIRAARGETIVVVDADGQHDPEDIPRLLAFRPQYDMVMGDRGRGGGASPLWRTPGKAILGMIANVLVGRHIPDLNCGLRAVDRRLALRLLPLLPNGFSFETTITIATLKEGETITWVPISVRPRIGRSAVRVADGFTMLMLIVRLVSLFAPLRVFMPVSLLAFAVGLWFMVENYVLVQEASVKALLAMLAAALFFLFGLLADQVAALRRGEVAYRHDESMDSRLAADAPPHQQARGDTHALADPDPPAPDLPSQPVVREDAEAVARPVIPVPDAAPDTRPSVAGPVA